MFINPRPNDLAIFLDFHFNCRVTTVQCVCSSEFSTIIKGNDADAAHRIIRFFDISIFWPRIFINQDTYCTSPRCIKVHRQIIFIARAIYARVRSHPVLIRYIFFLSRLSYSIIRLGRILFSFFVIPKPVPETLLYRKGFLKRISVANERQFIDPFAWRGFLFFWYRLSKQLLLLSDCLTIITTDKNNLER